MTQGDVNFRTLLVSTFEVSALSREYRALVISSFVLAHGKPARWGNANVNLCVLEDEVQGMGRKGRPARLPPHGPIDGVANVVEN